MHILSVLYTSQYFANKEGRSQAYFMRVLPECQYKYEAFSFQNIVFINSVCNYRLLLKVFIMLLMLHIVFLRKALVKIALAASSKTQPNIRRARAG